MLRADRLNSNSVSFFIGQRGENEIALRATKVVGSERCIVERERLRRRHRLRFRSMRHRRTLISADVVGRIDAPFTDTAPLQLVTPERHAKLQADFARASICSCIGKLVTDSKTALWRDEKAELTCEAAIGSSFDHFVVVTERMNFEGLRQTPCFKYRKFVKRGFNRQNVELRGLIQNGVSIHERPANAAIRSVEGNFEVVT